MTEVTVFFGGEDAVIAPIESEMGQKETSWRPFKSPMSAHLAFVDARGGCGVVLVVTPRRMMEMDDEIPLYETTAWSKVILPMRRQFRKVRRSRKNGPCVSPSSVTSMSKVSVRFGRASPRS